MARKKRPRQSEAKVLEGRSDRSRRLMISASYYRERQWARTCSMLP